MGGKGIKRVKHWQKVLVFQLKTAIIYKYLAELDHNTAKKGISTPIITQKYPPKIRRTSVTRDEGGSGLA